MKKPLIGVISRTASTVMITFPGTPCPLGTIKFIDPFQDLAAIEHQIRKCDVIILVRDLFQASYAACLAVCRQLNKPHFYFTDDNFILLRNEYRELEPYTVEAVREALESFSGVLLSSELLLRFYEDEKLHSRLMFFGPVIDPALTAEFSENEADKCVNIGFFGGGFRFDSFYRTVVPALRFIARENKVTLFVRERFEMTDIPGIDVNVIKVTNNFYDFVRQWQRFRINIVLHSHGASANIDFKTSNAALVSYYLGATPILADESVYRHMTEKDGVLLAPPTTHGWSRAINLRMGKLLRRWAFDQLEQYCRSAYSPERNAESLRIVAAS